MFETYREDYLENQELLASQALGAAATVLSSALDVKSSRRNLSRVQVQVTWGAVQDGDVTLDVLHAVDGGTVYDTQAATAESITIAFPASAIAVITSVVIADTPNAKIRLTNANSTAVTVAILSADRVWRKMSNDGKVTFIDD